MPASNETSTASERELLDLFQELFARIAALTAHELKTKNKYRVVSYTTGEYGEMVEAMFQEDDGKTPDEPAKDEAVDLSVCSICDFIALGGADAREFLLTALRKVAKWEANVRKLQAAQSTGDETKT